MQGKPTSGQAMNLYSNTQTNRHHQEYSFERLLSELNDKRSHWYDLRLAEMSGYDYIFTPDAVCKQLSSLKGLSEFLNNVQAILGSSKSRTVLISYWYDAHRKQHFDKYCIEWSDEIAINWQQQSLDASPQLDFIQTLFEHSEKLILES